MIFKEKEKTGPNLNGGKFGTFAVSNTNMQLSTSK
jgi:hypothetical protein